MRCWCRPLIPRSSPASSSTRAIATIRSGGLTRTSIYVTETTYGAMPEVEAAVAIVRGAHRPVRGRSERDRPYSAGQPEMAAWVHNVLTDSFLAAYQAYGPERLTPAEADRFVEEQTRIGALLDADPLPTTADELADWVNLHPEIEEHPFPGECDRLPPVAAAVASRQGRLQAALHGGRRHAAGPDLRRDRLAARPRRRPDRSASPSTACVGRSVRRRRGTWRSFVRGHPYRRACSSSRCRRKRNRCSTPPNRADDAPVVADLSVIPRPRRPLRRSG